jgi:hypothetical protein
MNFVFYTEIGSIMVESLSGELYLTWTPKMTFTPGQFVHLDGQQQMCLISGDNIHWLYMLPIAARGTGEPAARLFPECTVFSRDVVKDFERWISSFLLFYETSCLFCIQNCKICYFFQLMVLNLKRRFTEIRTY